MKQPFKSVFLALQMLLLVACSSGADDPVPGSGDDVIGTGIFIDGPVAGVAYQSLSHAGNTSSQGLFRFKPGERVTFSYRGIILGHFYGNAVVDDEPQYLTPHAFMRYYRHPDALLNIIRLLQTLDNNNNHSDGISLPILVSSTPASSTPRINFDQSTDHFAASPAVLGFLRDAGRSALISAEQALQNFNGALVAYQLDADQDSDGVPDFEDDFPTNASEQFDSDNDAIGDNAESDDDNDGLSDSQELLKGSHPQIADVDGDGILDGADNCTLVKNPLQADRDNDGLGDACDNSRTSDGDSDGHTDAVDNCPTVANANQGNNDHDAQGDACDSDDDNDELSDSAEAAAGTNPLVTDTDGDNALDSGDNCPLVSNSDQLDTDRDGHGDICEADDDNDGDLDGADNCPLASNFDQLNTDNDSFGDACDDDDDNDTHLDGADNCPVNSNEDQLDTDNDRAGDACDSDDDGDFLSDVIDNCPLVSNLDQRNTDSDAMGDVCDDDRDGDGVANATDAFPDAAAESVDSDGDGQGNNADSDDDNDGDLDGVDNCPVNSNSDQLDTDGDEVGNACDTDDDNDGLLDESDNCPVDRNPDQLKNFEADSVGAVCDPDYDNDGVSDVDEEAQGSNPRRTDSDGDSLLDGEDNCPIIANQDQANLDQDDLGDICDDDRDGDGVANVTDAFPNSATETLDTDGDTRGNNADLDDDNDGLSDEDEQERGSNPLAQDSDGDGRSDNVDNCLVLDNPDQANLDGDNIGDVCDADRDGDGVPNDAEAALGTLPDNPDFDDDGDLDGADNCPVDANSNQANQDGDAFGDVCDEDRDGDGAVNDQDAFPDDATETLDADGDGDGNNVDSDDDNDGLSDEDEAVKGSDPLRQNSDGDGLLDNQDNCPAADNQDQLDLDGDGIGDVCDTDRDGDGVANNEDALPDDATETIDTDGDTQGNNGDSDDDNDSVLDAQDNCPLAVNEDQANLDGDALGDVCDEDRDGDEFLNNQDNCPAFSSANQADMDGDTHGDVCDADRDGDGAANFIDTFPDDADEILDSDGDGVGNIADNCPILSNSSQADANANEIGDACEVEGAEDHDGDGVPDASDNCPNVSNADQSSDECGDVPNAVRDDVMLYAYAPHELDVLANDAFGLHGERAAPIQILTQPRHGVAVVDDNGTPSVQSDDTIWYTPQEGYVGGDELVYQISDASGAIALGRVYLGVLLEFSDFTIDLNAQTFKTLTFSWEGTDLNYADHLALLVSPDGEEAFTEVSGADDISSSENSDEVEIPVHLVDWIHARYRIEARTADNQTIASAELSLLEETRSSNHIGYIKADNVDAGDIFGASIALSGDGKTLAVGAELEDSDIPEGTSNEARGSGAVYVFAKVDEQWVQQSYIKAENIDASDNFGRSLALSSDGNTLVVGAPKDDGVGNAVANSGAAYVFRRESSVWTQHAYLQASNLANSDLFGSDVAISDDGDTIAISSTQEDSAALGVDGDQGNNAATNSGAVYVFTSSGDSWAQQDYLKASNTGAGDMFGGSLSLSADGDVLAVGAIHEGSNGTGIDDESNNAAESAGAVYLFSREGAEWSQMAYVKASNTETQDHFGGDVALSADGMTLVVGASGEDSNALGINGNESNNAATNSGAVYLFNYGQPEPEDDLQWFQSAYVKASNTASGNEFGHAVDVSGDGQLVVASARLEMGRSVGINGDQANAPSINFGAGAVYSFLLSEPGWSQLSYVKASNTGVQDQFGSSLAVSKEGDVLAVGARFEQSMATGIGGHQHNDLRNAAGAAYLY